MTRSAVLLALDALACFRLTRLVREDVITAPLRDRLTGSQPGAVMVARPRVAQFLGCAWCISIYVAGGIVTLQTLAPTVCLYLTAILAFSAVAGILSEQA